MKKINLLLAAFLGAATFGLTSCGDDCKDVTCNNGGTCVEGVCECPDNYFGDACDVQCVEGTFSANVCECNDDYEGDACDILSREKFLGAFSVAEVCGSGSDNYSTTITESSSDESIILISNFYNVFDNPVRATVNGSEITIASQTPDNDLFSVSGSGSINASESQVTISFSVTYPGISPDNCTSTYQKQ